MTPVPDAANPASQEYGALANTFLPLAAKLARESHRNGIASTCEAAAKAIRDLEAENARLRSAPIPAVQSGAVAWRVMIEDAVRTAMVDAWADIASDTGFWPDDLKRVGRTPIKLEFRPRIWADTTASMVANTVLASLAAPQSEPQPGGGGEREKVDLAVRGFFIDHTGFLPSPDGTEAEAYYGSWINIPIGKLTDAILAALSGKEQG